MSFLPGNLARVLRFTLDGKLASAKGIVLDKCRLVLSRYCDAAQILTLQIDGASLAPGGINMSLILLVLVVLLLLGALPTWPYSSGWGYGPSGVLGLILIIVLVFALMGRV